jgi:hypothetical protein
MPSRRAAVVCALALVAGCEAFFPLDDLGPGAASDAGPDATQPDAPSGVDAKVPTDSPVVNEAATEASADAGPPPCGFCDCFQADASFCDDFERGDLSKWTTKDSNKGGVASVVTDASVSPTHALHAEVPPVDSGGRGSVHKDFPGVQTSDLTLEFDVNPRALTDDQIISFGLSATKSVALVFSPNAVGVFEENDSVQNFTQVLGAQSLTPDVWQHLVIRLQLGGVDTIDFTYGADAGATTYNQPLTIVNVPSGEPAFDLGAVFIQSSPNGWGASFDNVVLRYK